MGDAGDGTCFETLPNGKKEFTLAARKWVEHKDVRFYNGASALLLSSGGWNASMRTHLA